MNKLNPRDKRDINEFQRITGSEFVGIYRYMSGELEWHELWDKNFELADTTSIKCKCVFECIRAALRRKGYPRSINDLSRLGFQFTLLSGGGSWYEESYFECSCGQ